MAFGDFLLSDVNSTTSVSGSLAVPTGFYVPTGFLVIVGTAQNTVLGAGTCTDTVSGNTFTALTVGLDAGSVALRGYYSIVTVPGIVKASCTFSGNDDVCIAQASFQGPFTPSSQLDTNPAILSDATTPFTSNLSGTLAQANELVISMFAEALSNTTITGSAPNVTRVQRNSAAQGTAGSCSLAIGSWVVSATTSISASFTSSSTATGGAVHIATFKQASDTLLAQAAM